MAESVTITDNRTGESIEIPINDGGVDANQWKKLLGSTWFFDPGYTQTASTTSTITEIDGDAGILRYRGYPIEQLAEQSTYLEVAYLLIYGELPTTQQFDQWKHDITYHTFIHENVRKRFMDGFHYDAHPMGMLVSAVAALSTFYLEAKDIFDTEVLDKQIVRLIAKMPTLAACAYRFSIGMPFIWPDNTKGFAENFLKMMFEPWDHVPWRDPKLTKALDLLFILHADHELNCGTATMRMVGSSHADPYTATAAAAAALYGPRHGGANEQVIRMLTQIGSVDNVDAFVEGGQGGQGPPAGIRPPGVQELRSSGQRSSSRRPMRCSRSRVATHCSTSRSSSKRWRSPTTTSSAASSIPTSTSTPGSSIRPWGSRSTSSPCCSPFPGPPAGWPTTRSSSVRTRRSRDRASSTSARPSARTWR